MSAAIPEPSSPTLLLSAVEPSASMEPNGREIRLVVVTSMHPARDARIFYRQAWYAAQAGYEVVLLGNCEKAETIDGVRFVPVARKQGMFARLAASWRIAWRAWKERGDLYHFHDPDLLLPMTLVHLLSRRPVVFDCHENFVDSVHRRLWIPKPLRMLLAALIYAMLWLCGRILGRVVIATPEQQEMFPAAVEPLTIRNFPPRWIHPPPKLDALRPFHLVHCGTLSPERGSRVMLEMLRILVHEMGRRDLRMLQLGSVDPAEGPHFRAEVERLGLSENLVMHGYLPLTEVPAVLAQAQIGLMFHQYTPQYRYGVASKVFDYMAAGLAIIGGQYDYDREFAPEGEVKIYVDQTNPAAYARAVAQLLENPEQRRGMGQRARELFENGYTADHDAARLLGFYQESLNKAA